MPCLYCNVNDTVISRDHILILTLQYLECYKLKQQKAPNIENNKLTPYIDMFICQGESEPQAVPILLFS